MSFSGIRLVKPNKPQKPIDKKVDDPDQSSVSKNSRSKLGTPEFVMPKRFSEVNLRRGLAGELILKGHEQKLLTPVRYSIGNLASKETSSAGPVSGEIVDDEDSMKVILSKSTSVPSL